nr:hypothetical protein [Streptomyces sp. SID5468]
MCSEDHAIVMLRRAVDRRFPLEATRTGGLVITRDVWSTGSSTPSRRTVSLEPAKPLGVMTPTMRQDLEAIADSDRAYRVDKAEMPFRDRVGRIMLGFYSVPPAAARRLVERGMVVLGLPYEDTSHGRLKEIRTPVRVVLAARLAMLAADHRTSTGEPRGYVYPADIGMSGTVGLCKPGRRSGRVYDGSSVASCTCGWSQWTEDREVARRVAREHRREMASAALKRLT